jgi:hypothetical protein
MRFILNITFVEPLTEEENRQMLGNLIEHVLYEHGEGIAPFDKILIVWGRSMDGGEVVSVRRDVMERTPAPTA